jgi:hypothetical protein
VGLLENFIDEAETLELKPLLSPMLLFQIFRIHSMMTGRKFS